CQREKRSQNRIFRVNVRAFLARFCISNFSLLGLCKSGFVFLWSDFPFQKPIHLLKVSFVILSFQKIFLVLLIRFLRRFEFQVVSVTGALKLRLI
ncbi:TPA: hypothetical protein ACX3HZ_004673, partial [Vibrio parahaemolyticus]